MRFFLTGIGGFAGTHLADHLLVAGHEVFGTVTGRVDRPSLRMLAERHRRFDTSRLARVDVTEQASLVRALADAAPDAIVHLAGIAFPPAAEADVARTFAVNVLGTVQLLEAARHAVPRARILMVSSSDAYGAISPAELPIREHTALRPVTVYGISKAAAEMAAFRAWWTSDAAVVRVRAFNHTGPGQSPEFVCSSFARQIAEIEVASEPPVLRVGNLKAVRDFSDVRDIVRGYALLAERARPGEAYNLCSGVGTSIADLIQMLVGMSRVSLRVVEDRSRLRGREIPAIIGDATRAAALGWAPVIALEQTLRDLLDHWRARVRAERRIAASPSE